MDFYNRIKIQMSEFKNIVGYRNKVVVNQEDLRRLVEDYECINERLRCNYVLEKDDFEHFRSAISLKYFEGNRKEGTVFMQVADILKPLIEEDIKRNELARK